MEPTVLIPISIVVLVLVALMGAIICVVPKIDPAKTLSQHAASSRRTYWLLAGALMGTGIPTYLIIWKWFIPTVGLGNWFLWILIPAFIAQVVTAFVPHTTGWRARTHLIAAYGLAAMLVVFMAIVALFADISALGRLLATQFVVVSLGLFLLVVFRPWFNQRYLYFQGLVIVDWIIVFLLVPFV